ncbi:hypothetical protein [Azospira oryzae]|uniref:hypothetical protein n=1 Tax=Azospira oryzae TaxID=146939 RepID=UPI0019642D20|nr:hypothetical protein [Azospira oryzae]
MFTKQLFIVSVVLIAAGCATVAENTTVISDERLVSQSAGALGYSPSDLTITSRRTEGVNTYVDLKAKDKKEFTCVINGGNLFTFGVTNPPQCNRKNG